MRRPVALRVLLVAAIAMGMPVASAAPASAHPLGNFTVNAASAITVTPGRIRVHYVLDLAEIPTFQELPAIDTDGDGIAEEDERAAWAERRAGQILPGLALEVDAAPVTLSLTGSAMSLRPGQGGLDILRLDATFEAETAVGGRAAYRDRNDQGRVGWREVTAVGADGTAVTSSTVPAVSPSDLLRAYPQDLLSSPLGIRTASFDFGPGTQAVVPDRPASGVTRPGLSGGALTGLVGRSDLSPGLILLALAVAFGVGALHALAPGHGKTVTAAYLAGAGGEVRQALSAGVAVAAMHTASVVALGGLILAAQRAFPAERVYPVLGAVAGLAAVALGVGLAASRLRHRHNHGHGGDHVHHAPLSRRGLAALALSGGLLPSPTAIVVLLAAASLGRLAFGLSLVAVFGLGLAACLTAIGILAVRARDVLGRRLPGRLVRALPVAGAGTIAAMGIVLTARAFAQLAA